MIPKFSKGDRVKLSADGLGRLPQPSNPKLAFGPERRGTIAQISRTGTGFGVLWDDRKHPDSLHADFLEHADENGEGNLSVYVDNPIWPYRGMLMCHMVADTPKELHSMADKIGMQRKWFQSFAKAKRPHYDISEPKRKLAVQFGAIEVDAARLVEICRSILANDAPWRADPEFLSQKAANPTEPHANPRSAAILPSAPEPGSRQPD